MESKSLGKNLCRREGKDTETLKMNGEMKSKERERTVCDKETER